jgi:hypothetical protein
MPKPHAKRATDDHFKDLALLVAVVCVRDTVIEDYHTAGKLSQAEMKVFNQQVASRLYTFFTLLMGTTFADVQADVLTALEHHFPFNWDRPEYDPVLMSWIEYYREEKAKQSPKQETSRG